MPVITSCATTSPVTSCHVLAAGDNGRGSQLSQLQLASLENVFVFLQPSQGIEIAEAPRKYSVMCWFCCSFICAGGRKPRLLSPPGRSRNPSWDLKCSGNQTNRPRQSKTQPQLAACPKQSGNHSKPAGCRGKWVCAGPPQGLCR